MQEMREILLMIISEKQIMQLMSVLYDSIRARVSIEGMFGLKDEYRAQLYNEIIQQQSEELKEIE
jgi:hypothetical protein